MHADNVYHHLENCRNAAKDLKPLPNASSWGDSVPFITVASLPIDVAKCIGEIAVGGPQ